MRRQNEDPPVSDLEAHIGYWLRRVSNQVSGRFARALQTLHVSVAEWVVLSHIHEREETKPGELAIALGLTRGAVSKILDKLETKNWITRKMMQGDNRVQLLSLTRHGRRILPQLAETADHNDDRFFECLETGEKAMLRQLLRKLTDFHQIRDVPIE
jgi:DNA-binding MarR family transcriptional regulator